MQIYPIKLIMTLCAICFSLSACMSNSPATQQFTDCVVGEECTLNGTLNIKVTSYGAAGVLQQQNQCVTVALSQKIVAEKNKWEGKKVTVSGKMYADIAANDIVSYELLGRNVLVGYCSSGKVLYLNSIK